MVRCSIERGLPGCLQVEQPVILLLIYELLAPVSIALGGLFISDLAGPTRLQALFRRAISSSFFTLIFSFHLAPFLS